ncbi:MAG: phosphoribosylformylglycinamidine cyclo-ligase, partial [Alphaproteobacteria bacterium]
WDLPECFAWVQKSGNIDTHELLKTFNCGIGMVLVIDSLNFDGIQEMLTLMHQPFYNIGTLKPSLSDKSDVAYIGQLGYL